MSLISHAVDEIKHLLAGLHHHADPEVKAIAQKANSALDDLKQRATDAGESAVKDAEAGAAELAADAKNTAAVIAGDTVTALEHKDNH